MPLRLRFSQIWHSRILAVCSVIVLISFYVIAVLMAMDYEQTQITNQFAIRLKTGVETDSTILTHKLEELHYNVRFLSQLPSIMGIMRASNNQEFDSVEKTPLELWKKRLSLVFAGFVSNTPGVTQLRFIGAANSGRELVRVDRIGSKVVILNEPNLQNRGDRDYFIETQKLPLHSVYLSEINLNREYGKIETPYVPTIRVATPVYAADGKFFGIVIMNVNAGLFLHTLQANLPSQLQLYIINQYGDFISHPNPGRTFGFDLGQRWRWNNEFTALSHDVYAGPNYLQHYSSRNGVTHAVSQRIFLDPYKHERYIDIIMTVPRHFIKVASITAGVITGLILFGGSALLALIMYLFFKQRRQSFAQQAWLASLVENSNDAIIGKTKNGRITSWNRGAEKIFGYSAAEAIDHTLLELIIPPQYANEEAEILQRVGNGEVLSSFHAIRRRKNGSFIDVSVTASPIRAPDGTIIGISKTARDISDQKIAEAKIQELNNSLEKQVKERVAELIATRDLLLNAARAAELGIWTWRLAENRFEWNERMVQIYGLNVPTIPYTLSYADWLARIHPDDAITVDRNLREAAKQSKPYESHFRIIRPDGSIRFIQAAGLVERNAQGTAFQFVGINRDITTQYEYENTLRTAKSAADSASRAKSEFVANMSHEIRSPMNAVLGMLQLLQQTQLDSRQVDYTHKAESAARALLNILNDILDFSKIEAGKLVLDPHPFSLDKLLREIAIILSANLGDKTIEIVFDIDPRLPDWIIGDALRLQQILLNLCSNAIKFTHVGEVILSVYLKEQKGNNLNLNFAVRDTGIGIEAEQREHIFEGFAQAEASTARRFGGTGLGLSICHHLVKLMGGTLTVDSEPGHGSTFEFNITVRPANPQMPAKIAPSQTMRNLNCLVVDDNPYARNAIFKLAQSFDWQTDIASNAADAIQLIQLKNSSRPYDVVLIDWNMPDLNGWHASSRIREMLPDQTSIILVMGTAYERELLGLKQAEAPNQISGELVKPITASMLFDAVVNAKGKDIQPVVSNPEQRLSGLRLLLVEDQPMNQQVASELLKSEGAQVSIAADGFAAIAAVRNKPRGFDLIIMDVQMPNMDGYAATRNIRQEHGDNAPPIIAMTANALLSDRQLALSSGMVDHISKPFDLNRLCEMILRHTGRVILSNNFETIQNKNSFPTASNSSQWNTQTALLRLANKQDIYQHILRSFDEEMRPLYLNLKHAQQEQNAQDAVIALHSIKNLAGMVGDEALAQLAMETEHAFLPNRSEPPDWAKISIVLHIISQQEGMAVKLADDLAYTVSPLA